MEDKYIDKYNELETEFFSTKVNWTYMWRIDSVPQCLDWDSDNNKYDYFIDGKYQKSFKNGFMRLYMNMTSRKLIPLLQI